MKNVTRSWKVAGGVALALMASACASDNAHRVETGGTQSVVSLNKIDMAEWAQAADDMIQSLVESGVLNHANGQGPAVLAISRVVNNTSQQVDTALLTKKIRVALNKSGKAVTTTTIGLGGKAEDPLAKDLQAKKEFMNDGDNPNIKQAQPDFSLSGKIIESRAKAGDTREVTYVFQLSLTSTTSGVAVWEDEKSFTKQGKHNSVGW